MIARVSNIAGCNVSCAAAILALAISPFSRLEGQTFAPVPALSFIKPFARPDPLPQVLTIASTGPSIRFTLTATTATGGNWLEISPEGTGCCTTPHAISVSVKARPKLPAGTYRGSISITSYPAATVTMTIPVTLTVAPLDGAYLDNLPGHLSFSMKPGGAPSAQLLRIPRAGPGTLHWSATVTTADNGNWLRTSAATGTAPAIVAVSITPQSLPGGGSVPGTYPGHLAIQAGAGAVTIPVTVTVGQSVLAQINPVHFTIPFGGPDPLPQVLTVASTGSDIRFTPVAATARGGNWLQVSPEGLGCCTTPDAFTLSVKAPPGMAAGTYTGQVTFLQYPSRSIAMTVPVTLTVARLNRPFFDNIQGQMSFSIRTGGSAPDQMAHVRNSGPGTLKWTLLKSTADGGDWLNVTATRGEAPSPVSVAIVPEALPGGGQVAGTFIGQVLFRTAGSSVSVPVSVVVGVSVFQQVSPVSFTMPFGGPDPLPQILTIAGTGPNLRFTPVAATANGGNWLQVSPQSLGCCTAPHAVTVSISAAALPVGTYTGQLSFFVYPDRSMSMTVPVTLTVAQANSPFPDNVPGQITFSLEPGGAASYQTMQIRNRGAGTLDWSVTGITADGRNWLRVSDSTGTAPSIVSVRVAPQALPGGGRVGGVFVGQLLIGTTGGSFSIPVTATVGNSVFTQVNPVSFTMRFGGANPLPQVLTVASTGSALRFTPIVASSAGGDWLQISPQGTGCCTTPQALTVSVSAQPSLPVGTYTAQITLIEYPSNSTALTVPVTLTVAGSGAFFDNIPGQMSFSQIPGGSTASQTVLIQNGGTGTLNWALSTTTADGGNWLGISAQQGTAPSAVMVSVRPQALPGGGQIAGAYTGQLVFREAGSSVTVPVVVTVGNTIFNQLPPVSFAMQPAGPDPLPQTLNVASTGGAIRFTPVAAAGKGGNWLRVSPQGLGCCSSPQSITVGVNAAGLTAGTYTGQITFVQYPSNMPVMTVPVYLTVGGSSGPAASSDTVK